MKVLVTGVTGYIGGRLVPRLLDAGHQVRVLVRDPARLETRAWAGRVEMVGGAVEEADAVAQAVQGMDAAYYLVQAMCSGPGPSHPDKVAALKFSEAAQGIPQVICLSGLLPHPSGKEIPSHLWSQAEVGEILASTLPTTEFRVGPIIGSGSAFFEMVRSLTDRVSAVLGPRWIQNPLQPIALRDLLAYLVAALGRKDALGVIEVGSEPLSFRRMMRVYARERGIRRAVIPLPMRAPGLSAAWIGLVTPLPNCLSARLVRGMAAPVLAHTQRSRQLFPDIHPISYRKAIELALLRTREQDVITRWSDALGRRESYRLREREGLLREVRTCLVDASKEAVFGALSSLGGEREWLVWNWAWRLRGLLDSLVGGPGLRRGRRDPTELLPGEAVDFWRVEEIQPPYLLRLRAEMKMPGKGWLQWETREEGNQTRLIQSALFEPHGFFGWVYWYGSYPFHAFIFDGMVEAIARMATESERKNGEKAAILGGEIPSQ